MPGVNGIEATRIIRRELPKIDIIGLSMMALRSSSSREFHFEEATSAPWLTRRGSVFDNFAWLR